MASKECKPSHPEIKPRQQETVAECIGGICLSEHLSDISFTFPNSQTKLPAHKLFLSMRSEVFEAMFYGPLAEKHETVAIDDIDVSTVKVILRFIYKDEAELDGNNVLACIYAGKKYALDGLVGRCSAFLETSITAENVCAIHEQAIFYQITALQNKCFEYMIEYPGDVLKSDGILELSNTSLQNLLASEHLSTDELEHFVATYKWAIHQCKQKNLTPDHDNLRACLGNVIFEIRFPLMSMDVFATKVASIGILTKDEMLMLYKELATNSQPTEGSPSIGRFSCKERKGASVLWKIAITTPMTIVGYHLNVSASAQVKFLSLKGSFVPHVNRIAVSANNAKGTGMDIKFKMTNDQIIFLDPVVCGPHSGNLQLTFHTTDEYVCEERYNDYAHDEKTGYRQHMHERYRQHMRQGYRQHIEDNTYMYGSTSVNMTKAHGNMSITLTAVPKGLTEIQLRRLL